MNDKQHETGDTPTEQPAAPATPAAEQSDAATPDRNSEVPVAGAEPRIAFVGCGHIAHVHMRYLKKLDRQVSVVCDASELRAREFATQYGIEQVETDLETMLTSHRPDVVHVLVPPHLHFALVKQCLQHDCHVLVEKPCCETLEQFRELDQLARDRGRVFTTDHTRVFNPMLRKAQKRLDEGRYGKVVRMEYVYDDPSIEKRPGEAIPLAYVKGAPPWFRKLRGGVITDLIPHPLSVMLSIDPALQLADSHGRVTNGLVEELIVRLHSEQTDGLIALSMHSRPLRNELRIYCERGSIFIDFRNLYQVYLPHRAMPNILIRVLDTLSATLQTQFRFVTSVVLLVLGKRHPYDGLDGLMDSFYAKIKEKDLTPVEGINVEQVTRLSEQIIDGVVAPGQSAAELETQLIQQLSERVVDNASVLVTGATGFIGAALVEELHDRGQTLGVIARSADRTRRLPDDVAVHLGDIRDDQLLGKALEGMDTVYHCAAAMSGDWAEFYTATVEGTRNLLDSVAASKVKKLVYLSSLGVMDYKRIRNGARLTEQSPVEQQPERRGSYTRAKKEAEDMVWEFKQQHPEIEVLIVRPGLVYGRENNAILNNAGVLLGNTLVNFGLGGRYFGLIHVRNLARMLAQLGAATATVNATTDASESTQQTTTIDISGPIHLVDPEQPTVRQYADIERTVGNRKLRVIYVPIFVWRMLFKVVDIGLSLIRKKNPDFSYRFNSNAKTLHYRSLFLEQHPEIKGELNLQQAVEDALCANNEEQPPE